jgi:CheY-like chemotaxis protein
LPLALVAAAEVEGRDDPRDAQGSILIVEDNAILRQSLEETVKSWGYTALTAASGAEALKIGVAGLHFNAIIMDYTLGPGPNGIEVALEIERRVGRVLPKLVLTGDTTMRLADSGASGFEVMRKPISADELRRKLADLLARR